jgi:hypothetical protein
MDKHIFDQVILEISYCCEHYRHQDLFNLLEKVEIGFQSSQKISDSIYTHQQKEQKKVVLISDKKLEKRI